MTKKNKISLNSSLIELVTEKTLAKEQLTPLLPFVINTDSDQYKEIKADSDRIGRECKSYKKTAEKLADKIVNMEFEDWNNWHTNFYNKYATGNQPCSDTMNEWIEWVEKGKPGFCADWHHCVIPVLEVAALALAAIPVVGWAGAIGISMGLGLLDGALYVYEGDEEIGGLIMFLSVLPAVPSVVKKFPFVKKWGKEGAEKMAGKIVAGKIPSKLEQYQLKALTTESAQKFLEVEVKKQLIRESVELGVRKEVIEGIGKYTAKQQAFIIKFAKFTAPMVAAGYTYIQIYDAIAKSGVRGPKKLIEKLWGIDPDEKARIIVGDFFNKVIYGDDAEPLPYETNWDFIKGMFNSSGSAKDGELMVQAIKGGWNPYEDGKGVVPKKYRTKGYNEMVKTVLSDEELIDWFMSDGSETDNNLLLLWIFDNPDYAPGNPIDEKYHTETRKKTLEKEKEDAQNKEKDDKGFIPLRYPDGRLVPTVEEDD
jgi:hypothetical protein